MPVNRFAEATGVGRCHADAPDCGCEWPTMEATLWMAYAQLNPKGMAGWLTKAARELRAAKKISKSISFSGHDVQMMVADGCISRHLIMADEAITPRN